jgi:hypothetical protein
MTRIQANQLHLFRVGVGVIVVVNHHAPILGKVRESLLTVLVDASRIIIPEC